MPKTPGKPAFSIVSGATTGGAPPRDLGQHGRELWDAVQREYGIVDRGGIEILAQACAVVRTLERLGLNVEAVRPVGRPPARAGWTGGT
jgi:hypothetical protein